MRLSKRSYDLKKTEIPQINSYAKKYETTYNYTMGEPDLPSPEQVKNAVAESISGDNTYYADDEGKYELREAIARYYNKLYDQSYRSDQVIVSPGGTCALYIALMAILDSGDEAILFTPHYSVYEGQLKSFGAIPKYLNLMEISDANNLKDKLLSLLTSKTKVILCNTPSNPTGQALSKSFVEVISQFAKEHDLFIVSDEVYNELVYSDSLFTTFANKDLPNDQNTIIINSFSKSFSMTGYRVGYIITKHSDMIAAMIEFSGWIHASIPEFIQDGAIVALNNCQFYSKLIRETYQNRRDQLVEGLSNIPLINFGVPQATFYIFIDISKTGLSSREFAYRFVDEEQVVVVPGNNYGEAGEGYIRVCFATTEEKIDLFINKFRTFLTRLQKEGI